MKRWFFSAMGSLSAALVLGGLTRSGWLYNIVSLMSLRWKAR
jgi:hypothetical protein